MGPLFPQDGTGVKIFVIKPVFSAWISEELIQNKNFDAGFKEF
jgi:hypothetical protein